MDLLLNLTIPTSQVTFSLSEFYKKINIRVKLCSPPLKKNIKRMYSKNNVLSFFVIFQGFPGPEGPQGDKGERVRASFFNKILLQIYDKYKKNLCSYTNIQNVYIQIERFCSEFNYIMFQGLLGPPGIQGYPGPKGKKVF